MLRTAPTARPITLMLRAVLALGVLFGLTPGRAAAAADDETHYFRLEMSDTPAGWMRTEQRTADGRITTTAEMNMRIKRGPVNLEISMSSEFVETAEGKPISMSSSQKIGALPTTTRVTFTDAEMSIVTDQNGRTNTTTRPLPGKGWMTPAAAGRFTREKLAAGEKTIAFTTIEPLSGPEPISMTRTIGEREVLTIGTASVRAIKTTVETSSMKGVKTVEYLDDDATPVRSETMLGGLKMTMIKAGPEVVRGGGEAPEIMVSSFIKPDRAIRNERSLRRAEYVISNTAGPLEIPSAGPQRAEVIDERTARVTVDLDHPQPAPADDAGFADYLASSNMIDARDPDIAALAERAVKKLPEDKAGDPGAQAEAIRREVFRHVKKKSLDVGFASASEVVKSGEGDCSEHGVLLAAALRSRGIPARVVAGVVYVDQFAGGRQVFGYHMWTQALLEIDGAKRWVDVDATLDHTHATDATHIALSHSALGDGDALSSLGNIVTSLGALQIKVESTGAAPNQPSPTPAARPAK